LVEFLKKGDVIYEGYYDSTCTYELDETPPFNMDEEAIDIALQICLLFKMNIIKELHICRKNYVDGSVPGGFQRTASIGWDGELLLKSGKIIGIESIFLEEDAARRTDTKEKTIYFRVDRLGIPLVEITTTPDIKHPEEARDAAYRIGLLLRSTGNVKRVLGSTRQDINISIAEGERIEIKGVQKLDWIPILVENEVKRQLALVKIKKSLEKSDYQPSDIKNDAQNVTDIFKDTDCKFMNSGIKHKKKVMGMKVPGFNGLYGVETLPNQRFGTEVAGKVKVLTRLQGLIHSDEDLEKKYHFSPKEIEAAKERLDVGKDDLFILLMGGRKEMEKAFDIIVKRTKAVFGGVPPETRRAEEDGTTTFLRELSGGRRLYPDTDSLPVTLDEEQIEEIEKNLGPYPWDVIEKYSEKYDLEEDAIETMITKGKISLFETLVDVIPDEAMLIYITITEQVKSLRRDGLDTKNLSESHFVDLFKALKNEDIAKEAFEKILTLWTKKPELSIEKAIEEAGIETINDEELTHIIEETVNKNIDLVKERGMGAMGPLMGDLMQTLGRGAVDGKVLSQKLRKMIQKYKS
ncbi:MAG TPA: Glu-tRNA(Gln) amidotransferase subunit GatE, partial [Patescibacteria group bacterium]|nr:Glu-tRNA(Gln) amidotransferase subunit GatE [Patescibacteria group bacterium]